MSHASAFKLSENFFVSWDPEKITSHFPLLLNSKNLDRPYTSPNSKCHWQLYSNINAKFARNFFNNFKAECIEVANKLTSIQKLHNKKVENPLLEKFLSHKITPNNVNLIATVPGQDIELHSDVRKFCINIGLKNSNKWITSISQDANISNFKNSIKNEFTLNDGDVYLLNINNPHLVRCIDPSDKVSVRYVCTYSIY